MIHTVIGATVACGALGFIVWSIVVGLIRLQFYSGRRAFFEGEQVNPHWSERKRRGWWHAWGEHKRARLGFRG